MIYLNLEETKWLNAYLGEWLDDRSGHGFAFNSEMENFCGRGMPLVFFGLK